MNPPIAMETLFGVFVVGPAIEKWKLSHLFSNL